METTKSITIDTPIKEIRFPRHDRRIHNALFYNEVETVGDLVQLSRDELKKFNNLGVASINSIEDWLESHGVSLGDGNFQSPADSLDLTPQDWEQRRYEVAKEILHKLLFTTFSCDNRRARAEEISQAIDIASSFVYRLRLRSEEDFNNGAWE